MVEAKKFWCGYTFELEGAFFENHGAMGGRGT